MKIFSILVALIGLCLLQQTYALNTKIKTYQYIINTGGLVYDNNIKKISEEDSLKGILHSLQHPQNIDKLGLFGKQDETFTGWKPTEEWAAYYILGKINFSDGKTGDLIKAQGLYFVYYDSKYYILPTLSGTDINLIQWWHLDKKVILDQEDKFLSILKDLYIIPKEIRFEKNGKEYKLNYKGNIDNYGIVGLDKLNDLSEQIGKELYIESRIKEPIYDEEVQKSIANSTSNPDVKKNGDLSESYKDTMGRQLNMFKADGLYLKLTENQYALYVLDIPDGGYEDTGGHPKFASNALKKPVYINLKNGKKRNLVLYNHTLWRNDCGLARDGWYISLLKASYSFGGEVGLLKKSDFKVIGNIQGTPIFVFKNRNNPYLKGLYKNQVHRKVPAFDNFTANMPLFIWVDPFGRTVISTLIDYFGGDVLDMCM